MVEVYVTSAFSKNNSGGNKAGIVLEDYNLKAKDKMELAKKLGYSETAFLSPSEYADYKIEYFTPTEEVPLCGHATIAAFVTLGHLNRLSKSSYTIETKAGILKIMLDTDGMIFMEQNKPQFYETLEKADLSSCFDLDIISTKLPIQIVSTGLRDILVPIDNINNLKEAIANLNFIAKISKDKNVVGLHAFSLTGTGEITALCRNFAPLYGIDEESATGTSNCALACYLFKYGLKQKRYTFEQGHNLQNISQIVVNIESQEDIITSVMVGGYGYIVCKKTLGTSPFSIE
ncbi:PhzF family phenazine biosynthesis protein [Alloiococcus sp. CFN-8]|uniref:PhzF family phenazine biosynthesis protein n=1 Tax=Alloiococcus sp. CFN-8 TaxID=3416081 RepID=UPI003CF895EA